MNHPHPTPSSARVKRYCCELSGIFVIVAALFGTFSSRQAIIASKALRQQSIHQSSIGLSPIQKVLAAPYFSDHARKTNEQLQEQRGRDLNRVATNKVKLQNLAISIDAVRDDNRELELQIAFIDGILGLGHETFEMPSLRLDLIQRIMKLRSYADIDALTNFQIIGDIRILAYFGLESNPHFKMLWTNKNGKELHDWQSKHGHIPHIATEDANKNVMKVRLADYLGIGLPLDAATDVDNGDGDTVDATVGATKGDGYDTDNRGVASVILSDIGDGNTVDAAVGATKGDGHDTYNGGVVSVILSDVGDGGTADATVGATKGDGHDTDNSGVASVILSDIYSDAAIRVDPGMERRQAADIL
jgi:hypothetical protein